MRIALVRHAPVRFSASRWTWPSELRSVVAEYNQAPVDPVGAPQELLDLMRSASVISASALLRSIRTAELLAPGREVIRSDIFDEAALPSPLGLLPPLPAGTWFVILRVAWLLGCVNGRESRSKAMLRARLAAERLADASKPDKLVVLVGHGIFMALMARPLEDMGWRRLGPLPRRPWSICTFEPSRSV